MTPQTLMNRRVNTAFLIMTLTLAVQSVVTVPTSLFTVLRETLGLTLIPAYYTDFVLVQFLYPIANVILVLLVLRIIRLPAKTVVTVQPLKADFIPWLGLFLGVTVGMNYLVNGMMALLEAIGIHIPDIFASYDPETWPQAVCYFLVLAILPPIAEEILCRAGIAGLMKHLHPWSAVLLSAFAFGWMHATVQQIPFAFVLGLVLGFVYIKTGNLLYPILFHFANNAWACVLTYLSVWAGEDTAIAISYGADLVFAVFGIASLVYLLCKKQFTLKEIPHSLTAGEARKAALKSPWLWVFTVLYAFTALANLAVMWLAEHPEIIENLFSQLESSLQ